MVNFDANSNEKQIYSYIISAFSKIVAQFNRNGNMKKVSNKWFSSFLWISINNKIADLVKTNNYNKRSPLIECAICKKQVTHITKKHLMEPGHEEIHNMVYRNRGMVLLGDNDRSVNEYIEKGRSFYENFKSRKIKAIFEEEALSVYNESHDVRNKVLSLNVIVSKQNKDTSDEWIDFCVDDVFCNNVDLIDEINFKDKIKNISEEIVLYGENEYLFIDFFGENYDELKLINTISDIVEFKINCYSDNNGISNEEIDTIFNVPSGFSYIILDKISKNKYCKNIANETYANI